MDIKVTLLKVRADRRPSGGQIKAFPRAGWSTITSDRERCRMLGEVFELQCIHTDCQYEDDTLSFSILNPASLKSSLISAYGGTEGLLVGQTGISSGSILMMHS